MQHGWFKTFLWKVLKPSVDQTMKQPPRYAGSIWINLIHKIQTSYPHITHQQFPFTRHKESNLVSSTQLTHEFLVNSTSLQWHCMVEIHGCKDESGGFSTFRRPCNTKGPKQSSFSFISGIASTAPWDESKKRQRYIGKTHRIRSRRVVYWQYLLFSSSRI